MPRLTSMLRPLLLAALALQGFYLSAQVEPAPNPGPKPGPNQPAASQDLFPGISASETTMVFPGITPNPIGPTPLAGTPSVLGLDHLEPAQMSDADNEVVSNLTAELSKQAALANFDISKPEWHYQQVVCPAFPDYVFLAFAHGPDAEGSSRFAAILPRNSAEVRIITTYAHGLLPFEASWNRPSSFEVFNSVLGHERGKTPISMAPNWLVIGMCYAELSGYPVQVLSSFRLPEPTLDLLRLDANQPQMVIGDDQGADITFSDVSRPSVTSNWSLHFDRHGQITSVGKSLVRQPDAIALKP